MLVMSPTSSAVSRVLLLADRRDTPAVPGRHPAKVRRYRLARLRLNDRPAPTAPHAHLKRVYD
jgi:hypothetical protein